MYMYNGIYICIYVYMCVHYMYIVGILLYILDSGAGGELNKTACTRNREEREKKEREEREAEEKKKEEEMKKYRSSDSYTSNVTPNTAFQIRNRFLSRVGTKASTTFIKFATFNLYPNTLYIFQAGHNWAQSLICPLWPFLHTFQLSLSLRTSRYHRP